MATIIPKDGMEVSKTPAANSTKVTRKYEDANDQHVKAVVLYPDGAKKLYRDAAKTNGIDKTELARLASIQSVMVLDGATYKTPTAFTIGETYTTVTCGDTDYFSKEK